MDAFAVSIATGVILKDVSSRQTFRLSWHFGLFQAMMPVIGWAAGMTIRAYIERYDHWVAFGLLTFVGANMIKAAFQDDKGDDKPKDPTRGMTLVMLSVATSIDALAVGLSLSILNVSIWT
ncbi:MAG: manganese efflux pump, partial [Deltaproteobacteria bacterium]|nr:manganese efflux pump [Deltaproteobacteria bacterium]